MCGLESGRRFASHLLADEVGGSLLLEPHGDAVATTRRADHVTVVVQNDVDSGAIGQVEDACLTLAEVGVRFPASAAEMDAQTTMARFGCS